MQSKHKILAVISHPVLALCNCMCSTFTLLQFRVDLFTQHHHTLFSNALHINMSRGKNFSALTIIWDHYHMSGSLFD